MKTAAACQGAAVRRGHLQTAPAHQWQQDHVSYPSAQPSDHTGGVQSPQRETKGIHLHIVKAGQGCCLLAPPSTGFSQRFAIVCLPPNINQRCTETG